MRIMCYAFLLLCLILGQNVCAFAQNCTIDYSDASLVEKTADTEVYSKSDGTKITKFGDRDESVSPDGTRITCYRDGRRVVQKPGGEIIEYRPDGSVSYTVNGQKREASMNGKTPYGLEIKDVVRTIQRGGFVVELVYSSARSDDLIDNYTGSFFTALGDQIEKWLFARTSVKPGRAQVLVSNCRFCVTGYCAAQKTPRLEIVLVGGNEKNFTLTREDMINKKMHAALAVRVVEELFGR